MESRRRVDLLYPQRPVVPLHHASIPVRVLQRLLDAFPGNRYAVLRPSPEPLCELEYLLMPHHDDELSLRLPLCWKEGVETFFSLNDRSARDCRCGKPVRLSATGRVGECARALAQRAGRAAGLRFRCCGRSGASAF